MTTVYAVLHALLSLLIPIPNLVLIVIVCKLIKRTQAKGYIFIINLAAADLLVGLMCVVETLDDVYDGDFDRSLTSCLLRIGFTISPCVASVLTLLCISLDRWLAVSLPLRYCKMVTNRTILAVLVALWSLSFLVGNLPLIAPSLQQTNYTGFCGLLYSTGNHYLYVICFIVFMPVLLILLYVHIIMARIAFWQQRRIQQAGVLASPFTVHRPHFKALRTILVVILGFCLSWGPYYITGLLQAACPQCNLKDLLKDPLFLLGEALNDYVTGVFPEDYDGSWQK
ncbi:glucose-dependent insulinotropic receptor-like [Amia ocellicauda]|uniref:glucose-dependent insulinotropic receptor-like n=1 Tax=Amia ocellicauda TaxID=2972642 RepID=UPI003463DC6B